MTVKVQKEIKSTEKTSPTGKSVRKSEKRSFEEFFITQKKGVWNQE